MKHFVKLYNKLFLSNVKEFFCTSVYFYDIKKKNNISGEMRAEVMNAKRVTNGERSAATRKKIVSAARLVFVKYPYHQASIRMIAAELL